MVDVDLRFCEALKTVIQRMTSRSYPMIAIICEVLMIVGVTFANDTTPIPTKRAYPVFVHYHDELRAVEVGHEDTIRDLIRAFSVQNKDIDVDLDALRVAFRRQPIMNLNALLSDIGVGAESSIHLVDIQVRDTDFKTVFNLLSDSNETERILGFPTLSAMQLNFPFEDHFKVQIYFQKRGVSTGFYNHTIVHIDWSFKELQCSINWRAMSKLKTLRQLDLSHNELRGSVDWDLLPNNLMYLHLDHNKFSGSVNLAALTVESADLSHNNFSGTIDVTAYPLPVQQVWLEQNPLLIMPRAPIPANVVMNDSNEILLILKCLCVMTLVAGTPAAFYCLMVTYA